MKTIGVLGLGSIGTRHAENLVDMGHEVVTYDPKVLGCQAETVVCVTLEAFHNIRMDGLVIASPTRLHLDHLMKAIDTGAHVLVEKPVARFPSPCLMGMDLSKVMVGNNLRFHDCVERARSWLPSIGTPIWANFTCAQFNDRPDYLRDGVTLNWGAHEVDLALHLLGPAKVVGANIDQSDECADILLEHASGCSTTVHLDYLTKPECRAFTINCTKGALLGDFANKRAVLWGSGSFNFETDWNETYLREMQAFIGRIDGKEDKIGATGQDGLECLKLLLDAKRMAGL